MTTSRSSILDGKDVYLDPGQKMCPFGLLHWKHTYGVRTPRFPTTDRLGTLRLAAPIHRHVTFSASPI